MHEKTVSTGKKSEEIKKSKYRLMVWSGLYVVSMALATFGPEFLWEENGWLTGTGIGINLIVGLGMILSNKNYLLKLDELMQRIQLEAMGVTLGIGVVAGLSYSLLDTTNLIAADAEIGFLVLLMGVVYLSSIAISQRRYG
jgi:hypothetical protein